MSARDYTLAQTAKGNRIHRATCSRIPTDPNVALVTVEDATPYDVATATLATCCKPKGAQVYVDAARVEVDAAREDDGIDYARHGVDPTQGWEPTGNLYLGDEKATHTRVTDDGVREYRTESGTILQRTGRGTDTVPVVAEAPATVARGRAPRPAGQGNGGSPATHAAVAYHGAAKHFWTHLGVLPARHAAKVTGTDLKVDAKERTFTFVGADEAVAKAAAALNAAMDTAGAALKEFKATDTEWQGMPKVGSAAEPAYARLRDFLVTHATAVIDTTVAEDLL